MFSIYEVIWGEGFWAGTRVQEKVFETAGFAPRAIVRNPLPTLPHRGGLLRNVQ